MSIIPSVAGGAADRRCQARDSRRRRPARALSADEIRRYSRHLILPEVGMDGQRQLKAAKVLCIGAGGLGSPAAMYLAAAGVGTLGIVDFDVVDMSNLQRQMLHGDAGRRAVEARIGQGSSAGAQPERARRDLRNRAQLGERARAVRAVRRDSRRHGQLPDAVSRERRLRAARASRTPTGASSASRDRRRCSATKDGPCYRCLYPEPPPPGLVPSCAEGGVLGVLPGIIGTIQATETIKLILGKGEPLIGRFLIYDALRMRFRELKLRKDADCPVCGTHPTVTELIDYEQFCGVGAAAERDGGSGHDDRRHDGARAEGAPRSRRADRGRRRPRAAGIPDQPHSRARS